MTVQVRYVASVVGAGLLVGTWLSSAFASQPAPFRALERSNVKRYAINGSLTVSDVLRVQKNSSVYGRLYAHGGEQVWQGLTVTSGGLTADALNVKGVIQGQTATIKDALQAGDITGTSISATGDARISGVIVAQGKITGNGIDGGAGGVTTTGSISGGQITAQSVTDAGQLTAGSIQTSGNLSAGNTTLTGLTVTGQVNLSNATVTGLNLGSILNGQTFQSLNVSNALAVGTTAQNTAPISLAANGHTVQLGVDQTSGGLALGTSGGTTAPLVLIENGKTLPVSVSSTGALSVDSIVTTSSNGGIYITGTGGITTPSVQAPTPSSGTQQALVLQGNGISLSSPTTLTNNSDLMMTHSGSGSSSAASHLLANGDIDLAGTITVHVPNGSAVPAGGWTQSVTFAKSFSSNQQPAVVVTPTTDPFPDQATAPKVYVSLNADSSGNYISFTLHLVPNVVSTADRNITFAYHVIGG